MVAVFLAFLATQWARFRHVDFNSVPAKDNGVRSRGTCWPADVTEGIAILLIDRDDSLFLEELENIFPREVLDLGVLNQATLKVAFRWKKWGNGEAVDFLQLHCVDKEVGVRVLKLDGYVTIVRASDVLDNLPVWLEKVVEMQ